MFLASSKNYSKQDARYFNFSKKDKSHKNKWNKMKQVDY